MVMTPGWVRVEMAVIDDPARLSFQIGDHVLILYFEHHAFGQHGAPVRHQNIVSAIVSTELGEVVSEGNIF